jgi:hypothetical protein
MERSRLLVTVRAEHGLRQATVSLIMTLGRNTMNKLITRILDARTNLFYAVFVATLLAFGVNITSSWTALYFDDYPALMLTAGGLFIALAFLIFIRTLIRQGDLNCSFETLVLLDLDRKCVIPIHDYDFSEKLAQYTKAAFLENPALTAKWESGLFPPRPASSTSDSPSSTQVEKNKVPQYWAVVQIASSEAPAIPKSPILIEAVEFCILDFLSLHLSQYFDEIGGDESKMEALNRKHIPDVLLENRILSLLTTPIEDRPIFMKAGMDKSPPKGIIHSIRSSDGASYELFHLTLPKGTRISRPQPGEIKLDHKIFTLSISVDYEGFTSNLPDYFIDHYVSHKKIRHAARKLDIKISARLHSRALLSFNDWVYFKWLDSFIEYLKSRVCFESFLSRIDWASTATAVRSERIAFARNAEAAKKAGNN